MWQQRLQSSTLCTTDKLHYSKISTLLALNLKKIFLKFLKCSQFQMFFLKLPAPKAAGAESDSNEVSSKVLEKTNQLINYLNKNTSIHKLSFIVKLLQMLKHLFK